MTVDVVSSAPPETVAVGRSASPIALEYGVIAALCRRDTLRLVRERTRWIGLVAQPLMLWAILGAGFSESLVVPGAESVGSMQYLYPGILAMVLLFTSIFSTMSVIEDRESGFLQGVLVAPASPAALVLGKTAGVTVIVLAQSLLFLLAAPLAATPWSQISWGLLLAVILISNVALTCVNFVFAWILRSTQAYHALMAIVLMPLWVVSGAMFPPPGGWMGIVVALNPMTYGVASLRYALGSPAGAMPSLALSLGVITAAAFVSLGAAVVVTRRR